MKYTAVSPFISVSRVHDQHVLLRWSGLTPPPDIKLGKTFLAISLAETAGFSPPSFCLSLYFTTQSFSLDNLESSPDKLQNILDPSCFIPATSYVSSALTCWTIVSGSWCFVVWERPCMNTSGPLGSNMSCVGLQGFRLRTGSIICYEYCTFLAVTDLTLLCLWPPWMLPLRSFSQLWSPFSASPTRKLPFFDIFKHSLVISSTSKSPSFPPLPWTAEYWHVWLIQWAHYCHQLPDFSSELVLSFLPRWQVWGTDQEISINVYETGSFSSSRSLLYIFVCSHGWKKHLAEMRLLMCWDHWLFCHPTVLLACASLSVFLGLVVGSLGKGLSFILCSYNA